jgi:hypothetical protein
MASNLGQLESLGQCRHDSQKDGRYLSVPQPGINQHYNKNMGGVDLVDNSDKCYAITTRVKDWYWCLNVWF